MYSDSPSGIEKDLFLYSTSACHLCEQAETLVLKILPRGRFQLHKIDIAHDPVLFEKYGASIPVLMKADKNSLPAELFWPFDENKINRFLFAE